LRCVGQGMRNTRQLASGQRNVPRPPRNRMNLRLSAAPMGLCLDPPLLQSQYCRADEKINRAHTAVSQSYRYRFFPEEIECHAEVGSGLVFPIRRYVHISRCNGNLSRPAVARATHVKVQALVSDPGDSGEAKEKKIQLPTGRTTSYRITDIDMERAKNVRGLEGERWVIKVNLGNRTALSVHFWAKWPV